jgi:hypothetical protein
MPLFARAATREQAARIYETMNSIRFCALHQGNCFTIPNYDMTREDFDARNYWRGPVWLNINWMLSEGLKGYGYKEKADAMKKDMIQLPIRFGFHEYFDSQSGKGYGSRHFSWTTALFLDLVYEYYDQDKHAFHWLNLGKTRKLGKAEILNRAGRRKQTTVQDIAPALMASIGEMKEKFYNVRRGIVDYQAMADSAEYRDYRDMAAQLRDCDLHTLSTTQEKKAFWINLYNTVVVHGIVALGIKASVREVPDFFKRVSYGIGDMTFSAEDMEHGILRANSRPPYRPLPPFLWGDLRREHALECIDPRIHFALVCGSRSCAPIRFYNAEALNEQLDTAAKNFINSSEVLIVPEESKVFLSQIFKWYKNDFGGKRRIFHFLLQYLHDNEKSRFLMENMERIAVEYLFYDWNLNH